MNYLENVISLLFFGVIGIMMLVTVSVSKLTVALRSQSDAAMIELHNTIESIKAAGYLNAVSSTTTVTVNGKQYNKTVTVEQVQNRWCLRKVTVTISSQQFSHSTSLLLSSQNLCV